MSSKKRRAPEAPAPQGSPTPAADQGVMRPQSAALLETPGAVAEATPLATQSVDPGVAQEQGPEVAAASQTPEERKQSEIEASQDRAYRLSLDPSNEDLLEHLINPATGGAYTDTDLQVAIRNGHLREEIRHGEFGQTPYNLTQQTSSHNSYVPLLHPTVTEQHEKFGLHSFELDINRGDPGREIHAPVGFDEPIIGSEDRVPGDWYVHHDSSPVQSDVIHAVGGESHTLLLSEGLQEVADLDNVAPITLFIDLKGNTFTDGGEHTTDDLDAILQEKLGDKLYTPQDWIDSVPGAETLEDALRIGGWPTMADLEGRVLVVLTGGDSEGQLGEYAGGAEGAGDRAAFIAPDALVAEVPAWSVDLDNGEVDHGPDVQTHISDPAAVFYNTNDPAAVGPVHEGGFATRQWGLEGEAAFEEARAEGANVLGSDHVNPAEFEHSDSSDPENDIPSFTIIDPIESFVTDSQATWTGVA